MFGLIYTDELKCGMEINMIFPPHYYARHYVCHFQQSTITSTLDS